MKSTYCAMQASRPGTLELVERPIAAPGTGQVLIRVEACGICGADAGVIEGTEAGIEYPRVPGHEVVGTIAAIGESVPPVWKVGQRVGVGRLGGHCNECDQCRRGRFNLCRHQPSVGSAQDGGYAEMMLCRHTGLVAIPDELRSEEAAPLLCAGLATFSALRKSGAKAGDLVAILGIGGLGHLAIQYARKMGFKVAAVGRGQSLEKDALGLGAHAFIDSDREDPVLKLKAMGGAQAILTTVTDGAAASTMFDALAPRGKLMVLGVGSEPLRIPLGALVGGERSVEGSITGSPVESEEALAFSTLVDVRPMIETYPLAQAEQAYRRMRSGEATFRCVLTMEKA